MGKPQRRYCYHCGNKIDSKLEKNAIHLFCTKCKTVSYGNPDPVVSAVVVNSDREILLVLRDREPLAGKWCLPSGFAEINETIEEAALRELNEETGIDGKVIRLLDTVSYYSDFYGDLIWVSFEVKNVGGTLVAGDDARAARYFPLSDLPELAFPPNTKAVKRFIQYYTDIWRLQDSFRASETEQTIDTNLPAFTLFKIISKDSRIITENWVAEVMQHPTTKSYASFEYDELYQRAHKVVSQFCAWMTDPDEHGQSIVEYYQGVGQKRRIEGFLLSEVLSAISLTRKHIFAHVLAQGGIWDQEIGMSTIMEFMSRVNLFFDKAVFYITRGYEKGSENNSDTAIR
ncbi:MAG: NUDIX domain-containing protein [Candidatus Marinimicrobia bacterium]|nr:NUDIX domain-containing protein [Candidatus Neomarinimicrobiota bacterium]